MKQNHHLTCGLNNMSVNLELQYTQNKIKI